MIRTAVNVEVDSDFLDYMERAVATKGLRGEVVMVLPRPENRLLVMSKYYYPDSVYRLPSGGLNALESPEDAFEREVWEETGLRTETAEKIAVIVNHLRCGNRCLTYTSHVVIGSETSDIPSPIDTSERIRDYREVTASDLLFIADHLRGLFGRWQGFGKFRANVHDIVSEYLNHR